MDHTLDAIDRRNLRGQVHLAVAAGVTVASLALVASLVIAARGDLGAGEAIGAFAAYMALAFGVAWIAEHRLGERWLPVIQGGCALYSLQYAIGFSIAFPVFGTIGIVMVGIVPVAIALSSHWRTFHQAAWCVAALIPLVGAAIIPIGTAVWPMETRLEMLEAFAVGSLLSLAGARVLDEGRRRLLEQGVHLEAAHDLEHATHDELRRSEQRYREIVELSTEGIWVADAQGRTTLANDRAARILGFLPGALQGRNVLEVIDPEVRAMVMAHIGPNPPPEPMGDIPARRADGSTVWLSVSATRLTDDAGTVFGTLAMFNDVSHRHNAEEDLRQANLKLDVLASRDELTGLPNRRALDGAMSRLDRSRRQVGVLMIDIDRFKGYNDTNGHPAGDRALHAVAAALSSALRPSDRVYRYGGEEFLVLIERASDSVAMMLAERARVAVAALRIARGPAERGAVLTISVGAATGRPHEMTIAGVVAAADSALYQAKSDGRNRAVLAGPRNRIS